MFDFTALECKSTTQLNMINVPFKLLKPGKKIPSDLFQRSQSNESESLI